MRLQPPDQLSTLLIWIAAIFMAVKEGVDKMTPVGKAPMVDLHGWWSLLPLALLLLAAVVSIFRSTNGGAPPASGATPSEPWLTPYLRNMIVFGLMILVLDLGYTLIGMLPHPH